MNIQPLFDNVLIEPTDAEEKTASGILLPDTAKEKPQTGKVVAVGNGKEKDGKTVPVVVKVGDVVLYKKWGGNEVKLEGKEYTLVGQEDILAVIK